MLVVVPGTLVRHTVAESLTALVDLPGHGACQGGPGPWDDPRRVPASKDDTRLV